jgi:hypothetical protein
MQDDLEVQSIMRQFAADTGLSDSSTTPRRYLWTDAFAVCNYLSCYRHSGEQAFLQQALSLVHQVHEVLGQHRTDNSRNGWLSDLKEEEARQHPTLGGLRIGKRLNERQPGEPIDESLEWDQDGQYFHYLTKWMHALYCVSRDTGNGIYIRWALELAKTAHAAFVYAPSMDRTKRMYWKMSLDLSRPLIASMGQHDPLDGLITYKQLNAATNQFPDTPSELTLKTEIEEMAAMCSGQKWATNDALGIGGLLTDAYRLVQLIDSYRLPESARLEGLLEDIDDSLRAFVTHNQLNLPAEYRLAFRELGLAIGLQAITRMQERIEARSDNFGNVNRLISLLKKLSSSYPLLEIIQNFWSKPAHQSVSTWQEHADINNVMLATSLAPDGYLEC